ncbi:MAG TPA: chemotaxis protein CheW [Geobacteraceae bacterium]
MGGEKRTTYDIHSILTEMREEYWQGLAETEEAEDESLECVTFALGGEIYAFESLYAAEIIRIPRLVKVPRVAEIIVGVFNLRGEITAAVDFRPFLGLSQVPLTAAGRIIVVKSEKFATGLLTETVFGVEALSLGTFEPVVKSLPGSQREYIRGQLYKDNRYIMLLDIAKLLAAPQMVIGQ